MFSFLVQPELGPATSTTLLKLTPSEFSTFMQAVLDPAAAAIDSALHGLSLA